MRLPTEGGVETPSQFSNSHYGRFDPRRVPSPGVSIWSIMRTADSSLSKLTSPLTRAIVREKMADNRTILLAEDDPDDVLLTQIALRKARLANPLQVGRAGEEAIAYLTGDGLYPERSQYPLPIVLPLAL